MIGEGIDIQRLRVDVYLPRGRTELRFGQAMGRIVRRYEEQGSKNDDSTFYCVMPAAEVFDKLAKSIEDEMPGEDLKPKPFKNALLVKLKIKKMLKHVFLKSCDFEWPKSGPRFKKCKRL